MLPAIIGWEQLKGRKILETTGSLATDAGVKVTRDRNAQVITMKRRIIKRSTRSTRSPSERLLVFTAPNHFPQ